MEDRKDLNFRLFLYLTKRRDKLRDKSIINIGALENYCCIPITTIHHLLNMRRLLNMEKLNKVIPVLQKDFGFDPTRKLNNEELAEKELYEIFN